MLHHFLYIMIDRAVEEITVLGRYTQKPIEIYFWQISRCWTKFFIQTTNKWEWIIKSTVKILCGLAWKHFMCTGFCHPVGFGICGEHTCSINCAPWHYGDFSVFYPWWILYVKGDIQHKSIKASCIASSIVWPLLIWGWC